MNTDEKPRKSGTPMMSSEALVGLGITIAYLGLLCLMLAWAEHMRSIPDIALIWFVLGVVMAIVGIVTAGLARSKAR